MYLVLATPGTSFAGHGAPIIIVVPGGRGGVDLGEPARNVWDVTDAAPAAMTGDLTAEVIVAQHTLRAREAIVTREAVRQGRIDIPAGTLLTRVEYVPTTPTAPPVWCAVHAYGPLHGGQVDCLQSLDAKGALERFLVGNLGQSRGTMQVVGLVLGPAITTPVTYRAATEAELPTAKLGYRLCDRDADGSTLPLRFSSVFYQDATGWVGPRRGCAFGEWPDANDRSTLKVDAIVLRVSGPGDRRRFEVMRRIPGGGLAPFAAGQPVRSASSPSLADEQRMEARGAAPLIATAVAELAHGSVRHGEKLAQLEVVHGATGVLRNDVAASGVFVKHRLGAGQYVFGVPMHTSAGAEWLVWCAPQKRENDASAFNVVCFPGDGVRTFWSDQGASLLPTAMTLVNTSGLAVGFAVDRRPASLGEPMRLTYVFDRWRLAIGTSRVRALIASVGVEIRVNGRMSPIGHVTVLAGNDGVFRLPIQNGLVTLYPRLKAGPAAPRPPRPQRGDALGDYLATIDDGLADVGAVAPTRPEGAMVLAGFTAINSSEPPPNGRDGVPLLGATPSVAMQRAPELGSTH